MPAPTDPVVPGAAAQVFDTEHHTGASSGSGNALRAAVLGANDGLVSNLSLVMGVAGASLSSQDILVTGIAGLLAGACSMAMGEWISVQSSREFYMRQLDEERAEIRDQPLKERAELIRLYEARGVRHETAAEVADAIMADPKQTLDVMAREEFGLDPDELGGSALVAAGSSFVLFVIGAIIPVFPFFFTSGQTAVISSVLLSAIALLVIGGLITRITGRSPIFSALRQLVIGLAAAAVTYSAGSLIDLLL
jgi:VIT1/CCC1 family predicted Fe2+/Mn2+ transporter